MNPNGKRLGVVVSLTDEGGWIASRKGRGNLYFEHTSCVESVRQGTLVRFEQTHHKGALEALQIEVIQ
jgi:hypothetical protein